MSLCLKKEQISASGVIERENIFIFHVCCCFKYTVKMSFQSQIQIIRVCFTRKYAFSLLYLNCILFVFIYFYFAFTLSPNPPPLNFFYKKTQKSYM